MLSLALRGKVAITEDVLTAAFFDVLAEQNDIALLRSIIEGAHGFCGSPALPERFEFAIELWPRTAAGEPDVRIQLTHDSKPIATLLVEAKLGASKSGTGDVENDGSSGDQLARYLITEGAHGREAFLLYLTHHAVRPDDDLEESTQHLETAGHSALGARLLWTSWRSIERYVSMRDHRIYARVRELFHRVQMFWFEGIKTAMRVELRTDPTFYITDDAGYRWSAAPQQLVLGTNAFYRGEGNGRQ